MNNRLRLVDRERISGCIEGHDYGYNFFCIARSPKALLCWSAGTAYTSGRRTCYGASTLYMFTDRSQTHWHFSGKRIGEAGGRLSRTKILSVILDVTKLFDGDEDVAKAIVDAVVQRKTLLIEDGGPPLRPCRTLGPDAYAAWRKIPNGGFFNDWKKRR